MEIVDNKAILITTRRPNLITECIPKSEVIDTEGDLHKVAVHWGLEEAQTLNKLKIKKFFSNLVKSISSIKQKE